MCAFESNFYKKEENKISNRFAKTKLGVFRKKIPKLIPERKWLVLTKGLNLIQVSFLGKQCNVEVRFSRKTARGHTIVTLPCIFDKVNTSTKARTPNLTEFTNVFPTDDGDFLQFCRSITKLK